MYADLYKGTEEEDPDRLHREALKIKPIRAAESREENILERRWGAATELHQPLTCSVDQPGRTPGRECGGRRGCRGRSGPDADRILKIY